MTPTRTFSVALLAAATVALSACSSGGDPSPRTSEDPASQPGLCVEDPTATEPSEACLEKAREAIREYFREHPEEDVHPTPPADATPDTVPGVVVPNPPGWEPID